MPLVGIGTQQAAHAVKDKEAEPHTPRGNSNRDKTKQQYHKAIVIPKAYSKS